jgi:precorrin-3B synthase
VPSAADACPGMLTLHPARDGDVARVRLPGGYVTRRQWSAIAELACELGDGNIDITARGNVQVRGLEPGTAARLAKRAAYAGLLPSGSHDRARNITASPLAGLGHHPPARALVRALDAAIISDPDLAALPGRFVFAVDDGTGGAALGRSDVGLRRAGPPAELYVAGQRAGLRLPVRAAVAAVVEAARAAVELGVGTTATRIRDLPRGGPAVVTAIAGRVDASAQRIDPGPAAASEPGRLPLGMMNLAGCDVLVAGARLGRLTAEQVELTGSLLRGGDVLRLAAAGRVVIPLAVAPDEAADRVAGPGLLMSDEDAMAGISACSGLACSRSVADVRALARTLPGHPRTHWVGCGRGCGAPADADLVVATGPGRFQIGGHPVRLPTAGAS